MSLVMKRYHRIRITALAVAAGTAILLSACGDGGNSGNGGSAAPSGSQSTLPSPAVTTAPSPSAKDKSDPVQSISFPNQETTVPPGKTRSLTLKGYNAKKESIPLSEPGSVRYQSDRPEVIAVNPEGTVQPGPKGATGASATVTAEYKGKTASILVKIKYALEDTVAVSGGKSVVTNHQDLAVVINKKRALPETYIPEDLTEPKVPFSFSEKNEKRKLRKPAAQALEELFRLAEKDGVKLYGISGYRSYATQKAVYASNVKIQGEEAANKVSAIPGYSEHQTGLAIDVSSASAKFGLEEEFGATAEGKWLAAHAHEAGFIIRYPKGKEAITGYSYEPWHIRYVGNEIAREIFEKKWTLEEYFQDVVPVNG